jgi:hypothetical protein
VLAGGDRAAVGNTDIGPAHRLLLESGAYPREPKACTEPLATALGHRTQARRQWQRRFLTS